MQNQGLRHTPTHDTATGRARLRLASRAPRHESRVALDRVLELVERRELRASELRVLLPLVEHDHSVSELARLLAVRPRDVRRLGERLYARGLLRWRERPGQEPILGITRAGLNVTRPLLTATGARAAA
jgi:DNA-binding MarR family transcriptional regulator